MRHLPSHLRLWMVAACGLAVDLGSKHWAFHTLRQGGEPRVLIPHVLEFQTMLNSGALFGIGRGQTALFLVASALALAMVLWMFAHSPPRRRLLQVALGAILAGALGNMYDRAFVKLLPMRVAAENGQYDDLCFEVIHADEHEIVLREYPAGEGSLERTITDPSRVRLREPVGYVRDFIKIPTRLPSGLSTRLFGKPNQDLWPWVFNVADMLLVGGVAILAVYLWRDRKPRRARSEVTVDSPGPST
jgi:signal peptidase II